VSFSTVGEGGEWGERRPTAVSADWLLEEKEEGGSGIIDGIFSVSSIERGREKERRKHYGEFEREKDENQNLKCSSTSV